MPEQQRCYCQLMSLRRLALLKGDERKAGELWEKAQRFNPSDDEMLAAGYGV